MQCGRPSWRRCGLRVLAMEEIDDHGFGAEVSGLIAHIRTALEERDFIPDQLAALTRLMAILGEILVEHFSLLN